MIAHRRWRIALAICLLLGLGALAWKLAVSEQLRIAWNAPRYFYDGRHKLDADSQAVFFDLAGELWVRERRTSNVFVRIIPRAGVELAGEQNISFVSSREGERRMYKLRPQRAGDAAGDTRALAWQPASNQYYLYFEQRVYSNEVLVGYYKDLAYGPGGLFFIDPQTGRRIAGEQYSTLYVPSPADNERTGPPEWLWAAAANRAFVEASVTGAAACVAWDARYVRRVPVPASRHASGAPGMIAYDTSNVYLYVSPESGWLRVRADDNW